MHGGEGLFGIEWPAVVGRRRPESEEHGGSIARRWMVFIQWHGSMRSRATTPSVSELKWEIIVKNEAGDSLPKPFFVGSRPMLRQSFCVFMDVLGFAAHIESRFLAGEGQAALERFYEVVTQQLKATFNRDVEGTSCTWDVKVFTDNIILGYALGSWHAEPEFGSVADKVGRYQLSMALENFFVRGGISVGDLFLDANTAFGPSLLEAHAIEVNLATYPRVVLAPDVVRFVRSHIGFYGNPANAPQNRFVLCDGDGQVFVHYLCHLLCDVYDYESELDVESLLKHKENVISNLGLHEAIPRIRDKYQWVGHYHNYFCHQCRGVSNYSDDLRIDDNLLRSESPEFVSVWRACPQS